METALENLLTEGLGKIDNSLVNNEIVKKLSCLYDQISLFNPAYGLVNARGEELVVKHILDCAAPAMILKSKITENACVADLGSGSGLPGLVLASVLTENCFTLVERMGRRAGFLNNTSVLMGLKDRVKVSEHNLSEVEGKFDLITFRAFRPVCEIASDLDRLTSKGSLICIYKSSEENIKDEIQAMENYSKGLFESSVEPYEVPFSDSRRSLLIFEKTRA